MAITLLYGCCQIETCTYDLGKTRAFMAAALGAGSIEHELAREIDAIIPDPGYAVDHIGCGEAVFQVNQSTHSMLYCGHKPIHRAYLDSVGPCVTNLNYFIDDHFHARELLTAMGAPVHIEGPSSAARALGDYGPDNTRPGGDQRPFLFMGTRHLIGLDLEIMEPNFLRFREQAVQYPAFVHPRPQADEGDLLLHRLRIVVPDLDATFTNLRAIFTPAARSNPYSLREGRYARAFRMGIGGLEVEYCQPLPAGGPLADDLRRIGPGVVSITFGSSDMSRSLARGGRGEIPCFVPQDDLIGDGADQGAYCMASRDPVGFDITIEPARVPLRS